MPRSTSSNYTGLQYALEFAGDPGNLPGENSNAGTASWFPLEPNSYSDFGSEVTLTPRSPITATRQKKKGRKTDIKASAGFQLDFTGNNMVPFMPGFFFADFFKSKETVAWTSVSATQLVKASETGYIVGSLIFNSGFNVATNNGLKPVTASATGALTATGLAVEASPPAAASTKVVGYRAAAGLFSMTTAGINTSTVDATTLGLRVGQWVYVGGDTTAEVFATAANNGWARVSVISTTLITFDKTQNTLVADAGTGKTISLFWGDHIRNEPLPANVKIYTYQFERDLTNSIGYEYVKGSYADEITFTFNGADKITADLKFQSLTAISQVSQKTGTRNSLVTDSEAFNTASDLVRIRATGVGSVVPLVSYVKDLNINIKNNITILKALGVLGGFDANVGGFEVSGSFNGYFNSLTAVNAVNNATSLTLDFVMAFNNRAWLFDLPLFVAEGGKLNVALDQAIEIPLGIKGAQDNTYNVSIMAQYFPYLPTVAMPT